MVMIVVDVKNLLQTKIKNLLLTQLLTHLTILKQIPTLLLIVRRRGLRIITETKLKLVIMILLLLLLVVIKLITMKLLVLNVVIMSVDIYYCLHHLFIKLITITTHNH